MNRTPGVFSLTHFRTENPCAVWRPIYWSAPTAELVTERIEHAAIVFVQERLRRGTAHEPAQLARICHEQQPVELIHVLGSRLVRLPGDRREERARIAPPTAILAFVIGNQGTGELFDVVIAL